MTRYRITNIEQARLDRCLADLTAINYREACLIRAIGPDAASRYRLYHDKVVGNLSVVLDRTIEKGYVARVNKGVYKLTPLGLDYYFVIQYWIKLYEHRKLEELCSTQSASSCSSPSSSTSA